MRTLLRSLLIGLLIWIAPALSLAQVVLPDTSTRIGRAQLWVYHWTAAQYLNQLQLFDLIWSNQPTSAEGSRLNFWMPPNTISSGYTPVSRVPVVGNAAGRTLWINACANAPNSGGCTLAWFQANHPTWVMYKADQVTPAYFFGDTSEIPIDISNPAVQSWVITNVYTQILVAANLQAVSVDNIGSLNSFGQVGTCSIAPVTNCTSDGGTWTQIYTGATVDPTFVSNQVAWLNIITAYAHSVGKITIGNVGYNASDLVSTAALIAPVDVWLDEDGITGDADPSTCQTANPSSLTGAAWIAKLQFITGLNSGAGPAAYVAENSLCPQGAFYQAGKNSNFEMIEWAIAGHMLLKGSHTYYEQYWSNGTTGGPAWFNLDQPTSNFPQLWLQHGAASGAYQVTNGVYNRTFANALALVNPSTTTSVTYSLGASVYHRSDCTRFTGNVLLRPTQGMVLIPGEPAGCVP